MQKLKFIIIFIFGFLSLSFADETLTITTYYPSPYGSYNELTTASNTYLATTSGKVGIGTTGPTAALHVVNYTSSLRFGQGLSDQASDPTLEIGATNNVYSDLLFSPNGGKTVVLRGSSYGLALHNLDAGGRASLNIGFSDTALPTGLYVNGNVGIGTTNPGKLLEVYNTSSAAGKNYQMRLNGGSTAGAGIEFYNSLPGSADRRNWSIGTEGTSIGSFGIYESTAAGGSTDPAISAVSRLVIDVSGTLYGSATNDISDARLKKNIATVGSALDKIMQIRGVRFNWKAEANMTDKPRFGVIAQEVETVFPELVTDSSIFGKGYKSVQYGGFVAPFIEAIKELNTKITGLKTENKELKSELGNLKIRLSRLEAKAK